MTDKEYEKFCERYGQFKEYNLPVPFWDEERQTHEYVFYDDSRLYSKLDARKLNVFPDLIYALEDIAYTGFYYPFTSKIILDIEEDSKKILKTEIGHDHGHSFEEVVKSLYDFPESFSISSEDEKFYSKQELDYLRRVQKYLLFIGMKDLNTSTYDLTRYKNSKQSKYENAIILSFTDENIDLALSGKKLFRVFTYNQEYSKEVKFEPNERRALIVDSEDNFKMFIEFTNIEIKEYKEIESIAKDDRFSLNEKVEIENFIILEKY